MVSPESITERDKVLFEIAVELCANACGLLPAQVRGTRQFRVIYEARAVAVYLLTEIADMTLEKTGLLFSGRHYSTMIHARDFIKSAISLNGYGKPFQPKIANIFYRVEPAFIQRMKELDGESFYSLRQFHQTAGYI